MAAKNPSTIINIGFDDQTLVQAEKIAVKSGKTRAEGIRLAVRFMAYVFDRIDDGYTLSLLS